MLAACCRDPILGRFVDVEELRGLFNRTIQFFDSIIQPSSALSIDRRILIGLAGNVLGIRRTTAAKVHEHAAAG